MTDHQKIFEISGNFHTDFVSPWIEEEEVVPMDIYTASSLGYYDEVIDFLRSEQQKSFINKKNPGGWTPLMYASYVGHENVVTLLLGKGNADVEVRTDKWCSTALMLAASCGNKGVVYYLLQSGANINATDKRGYTALFYATLQGHQNVVKILVDKGADLERRENMQRLTPLVLAAKEGHEGIFNIIFSLRGNSKGWVENVLTARQLAYNNGHMAIVNLIDKETSQSIPKSIRSEAGLHVDDTIQHTESGPIQENFNWGYGFQGAGIKHGPKAFARLVNQKSPSPINFQTSFQHKTQPQYIPSPQNVHIGTSSPRIISHSPSSDSQGSSYEDLFFAHSGGTVRGSSLNERLMMLGLPNNGAASSPRSGPSTPECSMLSDFLHDLNLDKYLPTFIEQEVDFETLLTLDDADLKEIGIKLFGPRRKITTAIAEWKAQSEQKPSYVSLQSEVSELKLQLKDRMLELQQQELYLNKEKELRTAVETCVLEEKRRSQLATAKVFKISTNVSQILPELEELARILNRLCKKSNDDMTKEIFTKLARSVDKITPILKEAAEMANDVSTHCGSKDLTSECVHSKSG